MLAEEKVEEEEASLQISLVSSSTYFVPESTPTTFFFPERNCPLFKNCSSVSCCGVAEDESASVVLLWCDMSWSLSLSIELTVPVGFPWSAAAHVLPPGALACTHTLPFTPHRTNSLSLTSTPLGALFLFPHTFSQRS